MLAEDVGHFMTEDDRDVVVGAGVREHADVETDLTAGHGESVG